MIKRPNQKSGVCTPVAGKKLMITELDKMLKSYDTPEFRAMKTKFLRQLDDMRCKRGSKTP